VALQKKEMIQATISNYIHLIIKIVASLIVIRIIFLGLEQESYGFWALLWGIFGYSVLLDFGLGVTIQKKSAELLAANQKEKLTELFSTYLLIYSMIALLIVLVTIIIALNLESLFVIHAKDKLEEYQVTLLVFGFGSAIAFALGFAAEILRGLHILRIRNVINSVFVVLNGFALWLCVYLEQPLYMFALAAVGIQIVNNLSFFVVLKKHVPTLTFSKTLINIPSVKNSIQFSLSAYMIMFSNIMIFRTDQIVISAIAGVAFAGFYQIASRVSELFRQFSTQFHESLSTKSAMLDAHLNKKELADLIIYSNKIMAAIATAMFIPLFLLIEELLYIWLHIEDDMTIVVARLLLISMYILVVFRSSMVQVLLMNNRHTELMKVGILEAVINLVLSIILVYQFGMLGAAIGTLVPNVLLALFYNIPVMLRYTTIGIHRYFFSYVLPLGIALAITFYVGHALKLAFMPETFFALFLNGVVMVLLFGVLYLMLGFYKELKNFIKKKTCNLTA
jgi:O-antigen/teichoic acid export membrane protein